MAMLCYSVAWTQQSYYVSATGSDSGAGTLASPFATVKKAAEAADLYIDAHPTTPVNIWVRGGTYRNAGFTTAATLVPADYEPATAGEPIWKTDSNNGTTVRINNVNGTANAWITISPYPGESVVFEGDGDITFSIRSSSYIKVQGFDIKGVADKIPVELAWKFWGTYRYLSGGSYIYGDRKSDICAVYGISPCTGAPPEVLTTGETYMGLPDISALSVERPNIFGGKGLLVQLSHHVEIVGNSIHDFPGGGLRVTQSDYVNVTGNNVFNNSGRASVGTHGMVAEGLTAQSGSNTVVQKMNISGNQIYSNYNELYSWVQSKTIVTTHIDEGKGLALLRTSVAESNFKGIIRVENNLAWDNGKSGIHTNDVDKAEIINNTVFSNGHTNIYNPSLTGGTNAGISIQSSNDIKIINNVVVVSDGYFSDLKALSEGQNCTGEEVSNNLVWGGAASDFAGGYTTADPLFTDMSSQNVRLMSTSPAINAGRSDVAPPTDFDGLTRNAPPEIGAYEYFGTLPVELIYFRALPDEKGTVLLWATEAESEGSLYDIQKLNATGNEWETLSHVSGKGETLNKYSFEDKSLRCGPSYYRLKMTDRAGVESYSKVLTVERACGVRLFPNPFSDALYVEGSAFATEAVIMDVTGRIIARPPVQEGEIHPIDTSDWPAQHLYFVRIGEKTYPVLRQIP